MSHEIVYTSAPQGLQTGSKGFCTVVSTQGIADYLSERLEMLSGYRHAYSPGDPNAPVNYSHLQIKVGRENYHVLSRVCDAGFDYSQRSNKLAHHVALSASELVAAGPAAVLASRGFCIQRWDGGIKVLPQGRLPTAQSAGSGQCPTWRAVAGDPGWAGWLAETANERRPRPVSIIFRPGTDTLSLVAEAMCLLPSGQRWSVTFNTYFTKAVAGTDCLWRFVLDGTRQAETLRNKPDPNLLDLTRTQSVPTDSQMVNMARTGQAAADGSIMSSGGGADAWPTRRQPQATKFADAVSGEARYGDDYGASYRVPDLPDYALKRRRRLTATHKIILGGFFVILAAAGAVAAGILYSRHQAINARRNADLQAPVTVSREDGSDTTITLTDDFDVIDETEETLVRQEKSASVRPVPLPIRDGTVVLSEQTITLPAGSEPIFVSFPLADNVPEDVAWTMPFELQFVPGADWESLQIPLIKGRLDGGSQQIDIDVTDDRQVTVTVDSLPSNILGRIRRSGPAVSLEMQLRISGDRAAQNRSVNLTIELPVVYEGFRTSRIRFARRFLHGDMKLVERVSLKDWEIDSLPMTADDLPKPLVDMLVTEFNRRVRPKHHIDADSATKASIRAKIYRYYDEVAPRDSSDAAHDFELLCDKLRRQHALLRYVVSSLVAGPVQMRVTTGRQP